MMKHLLAALMIAAFALVLAAPSGAAKHRRSLTTVDPSITLDQADPHYMDVVTFTVTSPDAYPWVHVACSQAGADVYDQWVGEYPDYPSAQYFHLGPTFLWAGGDADCVAELVTFDANGDPSLPQATLSFHVSA